MDIVSLLVLVLAVPGAVYGVMQIYDWVWERRRRHLNVGQHDRLPVPVDDQHDHLPIPGEETK